MKRLVDGVLHDDGPGEMEPLPRSVPGVFETVLLRRGEPVFWAEHWTRLSDGCRWLGLELPISDTGATDGLRRVARDNGIGFGVGRIAAWRMPTGKATWRIEVTGPRPHMSKPELVVGWGSPLPVAAADRRFKHLGRGHWLDALRQARAAQCDEALLSDVNGRLVEGCVSNVFFVRERILHTPDLGSGILPGVVRSRVLAIATAQSWPMRESAFSGEDTQDATEIWLTNSLIGVRPVAKLAGRVLPIQRPLWQELRSVWQSTYGWDPAAPLEP